MKTAEAKKEMGKLLRFLKPLQRAEEVLDAAVVAESNVGALAKEVATLAGSVAHERDNLAFLATEHERVAAEHADLQRKVIAERDMLAAAEDKAAIVRETIRLDTISLNEAFAELQERLQGQIDELSARLSDLHTEEERVDAKLAQFEALSHEQG